MKVFAKLALLLIGSLGGEPIDAHQQQNSTQATHMHNSSHTAAEGRLIDLVKMCINVVDAPEFAKDRLKFAGWTDLGPDQNSHPVYREAKAGLFKKELTTLSFLSRDTSLGRENPDVDYPICEAILVDGGLSIEGANSVLAKHLAADGFSRDPEDKDLGIQHVFVVERHAVSVADFAAQPGTLQIMIMPAPVEEENPE